MKRHTDTDDIHLHSVVYTAATALIPARMYAHIRDDIPKVSLLTSWDRALHILRRLCPLSNSARRCLAALELLNDKLAQDINTHAQATRCSTPKQLSSVDREFSNDVAGQGVENPQAMSLSPSVVNLPGPGQTMDFLSFIPTFEQDTTWLDSISLPTDLLNVGYGELSEMYTGGI